MTIILHFLPCCGLNDLFIVIKLILTRVYALNILKESIIIMTRKRKRKKLITIKSYFAHIFVTKAQQ